MARLGVIQRRASAIARERCYPGGSSTGWRRSAGRERLGLTDRTIAFMFSPVLSTACALRPGDHAPAMPDEWLATPAVVRARHSFSAEQWEGSVTASGRSRCIGSESELTSSDRCAGDRSKRDSERCRFAAPTDSRPGRLGEARLLGWRELSRELG